MYGFVFTGQDISTQKIEDLMDIVKKLQKGPVSLLCIRFSLRFEIRHMWVQFQVPQFIVLRDYPVQFSFFLILRIFN